MKRYLSGERAWEIDPAVAILLSAYSLTQVAKRTMVGMRSSETELDIEIGNHMMVVQESLQKMVGADFFINEVKPQMVQLLWEMEYQDDDVEQE